MAPCEEVGLQAVKSAVPAPSRPAILVNEQWGEAPAAADAALASFARQVLACIERQRIQHAKP